MPQTEKDRKRRRRQRRRRKIRELRSRLNSGGDAASRRKISEKMKRLHPWIELPD